MSTSTFSFCWSGLTSTISPSKSDSGPLVTFTDSPSENATCARGRSALDAPVLRIRSTSPCESGTGFEPAPTNPVTPGVFLTTVHASSLRSMFTSTYPGRTRFSVWTFWPSFVSVTGSVGTTTRRKRGRCPIDSMRCSRLALTLFSWPEYVLTTYQRNTLVLLLLAQEDVLDDALPEEVVGVEEDPDDHARDQHDRRPLDDLVLPGPVDLLQLGPRLADEA